VLEGRRVMRQSLIEDSGDTAVVPAGLEPIAQMYAQVHRGTLIAGGLAVLASALALAALVIALAR
jgi:hypothetical protein